MKNAEKNYQKAIEKQFARMTLEQKIALCSGQNEWDTKKIKDKKGKVLVPSVKVADGPHGLRKTVGQGDNLGLAASEPSTCFPAESLAACSFDKRLIRKMGAAIADEAREAGVCTVLGPGVNIKRNPLCGRNFEYYSEDPYLSGRLAASFISGMQERGIGCSLKHFACNSQEYYRMTSDSRVDERTLREIYLSAFEYAVKEAKPATVMCAYNKLNGTSCSDNEFLLDTVLRKEWGYQGLVVSDWGALNNRENAFKAGCDLIMPGGSGYGEKDVLEAVKAGKLSEEYVDRSARRVAAYAIRQHVLLRDKKGRFTRTGLRKEDIQEASHALAQRIAEESAVLLKNEDQILPLTIPETSDKKQGKKDKKVSLCLIGSMADHFRYQGSGSSKINPVKVEDVHRLLNKTFGIGSSLSFATGYDPSGETTDSLLRAAVQLAAESEKVLIFAGLPDQYEAEGMDRRSMELPRGQNRLIEAVAGVNPNVIVVLISGCAVEIPWADKVKGILWMGLSGEAGGAALVRILSGEVNPSGRLAESWPVSYADCSSSNWYLQEGRDAQYREGLYVGYRHYEKAGIPVRFPFGHGLSYTTFRYTGLQTERTEDGNICIRVSVTNTGRRKGSETALFFVGMPQDGIHRPKRELKGFEKVVLEPGERRELLFETDDRTFAVWNDGWKTYEGSYVLEIGNCRKEVRIEGKSWSGQESQSEAFRESLQKQEEYPGKKRQGEKYTVESTIAEVTQDLLPLRLVYQWFEKTQAKTYGRGSVEYLAALSSAEELPLRALQNLVGVKGHFAQAVADFGNKKYLTGIRHLIK